MVVHQALLDLYIANLKDVIADSTPVVCTEAIFKLTDQQLECFVRDHIADKLVIPTKLQRDALARSRGFDCRKFGDTRQLLLYDNACVAEYQKIRTKVLNKLMKHLDELTM